MQIAKELTVSKVLTVKAYYAKQKGKPLPDQPYKWSPKSITGILERSEYTSCTVNFKTYSKSHKLKSGSTTPRKTTAFFLIHSCQSSTKKYGNGCRNYGQTSADHPRPASTVCSPGCCTVPTVGRSYTSVLPTASRPIETTMYAPTTRAIRVLVLHISSGKKY